MIFLLCKTHHHADKWRRDHEMERKEFYNKVVVLATADPGSFVRLRGRLFIPQGDRLVHLHDDYQEGKYFLEVMETLRSIGYKDA